jgi:hypothetical protein
MSANQLGRNEQSFSGKDFFKSVNQKQELSVVAMFGNGS